jgi:regulator of protease activity HflC (stomatin/prohibitin superfamily)
MSFPTSRPSIFLSVLLWAEVAGLLVGVLFFKLLWLLPLAALVMLIACLLHARPATGVLLALAALAAAFVFPFEWSPASMVSPALALGALVIGSFLSFAGILASAKSRTWSPLWRCLLRLLVVIHFICAGVLLAAQYLQTPLHGWLSLALGLLVSLLVADTLSRLTVRLYTPRRHWQSMAQPGAFFFFAWLGPEWRDCLPAQTASDADDHVSLKLADMWMWPVVRGGLLRLVAAVLLVAWAASCLHEVPAGSQGVRQHLGSWEKIALEPGLHPSLPWPLGGVQLVDTGRVREVVLGFRTDPGQPILWERAHYEGEQQSLVGGGDDFLSISVPILFRVSDPLRFLRSIARPEELLAQEAQRVLLTLALPRKAAQIMTQAREEIRAEFRLRLQTALDALDSGITITDVLLRDVHPPVSVAETFQEVISAMEDKEAAIHEAESNNTDSLYNAKGFAAATLKQAQSVVDNREAQVAGQTARFESRRAAWELSPLLFQWREGFRVFDDALGSTKKAILDDSIRTRIPAHIDLRKVLNPDFVSSAPPAPQTLIPRPVKSLEAFDMEIEGFVKMGQGEIPAPDMTPPDADNVLKNSSASKP